MDDVSPDAREEEKRRVEEDERERGAERRLPDRRDKTGAPDRAGEARG